MLLKLLRFACALIGSELLGHRTFGITTAGEVIHPGRQRPNDWRRYFCPELIEIKLRQAADGAAQH
jgi:hypothetical protein